MPELPEVETVVRTLRPILVGSTIASITCRHANMMIPSSALFEKVLTGQTFTKIERIGKFIIFFFTNGAVMVSHLRMEGKFVELKHLEDSLPRFAHVIFHLKDNRRLVYDDMRKFGTFTLSTENKYRQLPALKKLGIEPLRPLDPLPIYDQIRRSMRTIKSILLDQTILLGLGNIYADEVLFAAKIHPLTKGNAITLEDTTSILRHSETILKAAIRSGGTRIRTYRSGNPIDGEFTLKIQAYGRDGQACYRCQHRLDKITVGGRGTHYCPKCQHHPQLPFVIGVTGPIATGKSTLMNIGMALGFHTINADNIVHQLYETKAAVTFIKGIYPFVIIKKKIDRGELLKAFIGDPKGYQKVTRWLFPLVKSIIFQQLIQTKAKVALIEVPLLFQGNIDAYCDVILGVETTQAIQTKRLVLRQPEHAEKLLLLNERNRYQDFLAFVDIRLQNHSTLEVWKQTIHKTLKPFQKYL